MELTIITIVGWILLLVIVLSQAFESSTTCTSHQKTCEIKGNTMVCNNMIPSSLLHGCTALTIKCLLENTAIEKRIFDDPTYKSLRILEMHSPDDDKYRINFRSNCFESLAELLELRVSVARSSTEKGWLSGLNGLLVLNLTGCIDMNPNEIYSEFYHLPSLPNLQTLVLKRFGVKFFQLALDDTFWKFISERPINVLVLDMTEISVYDTKYQMANEIRLKKLSFRYCNILKIENSENKQKVAKIEALDLTGVILPAKDRPTCFGPVKNVYNIVVNVEVISFLRETKHLMIDELCKMDNPVIFQNISNINLTSEYSFNLETVSWKRSNIQVLDIQVNFSRIFPALTTLSLSENKIEFINPGCFDSSLKIIDISNNKLNIMNTKNKTLFGNLFKNLLKIEAINLSSNALDSIPKNMFTKNILLRVLDLSRNRLRTISFSLSSLKDIHILRISANDFRTLDLRSMQTIEDMINHNENATFDISGNDFQCKRCEDLKTAQWLVTFRKDNYEQATCMDNNGNTRNVDEAVLSEIQFTCKSPLRLGLSIGLGVGTLLLISFISFIIMFIKRKKKRQQLIDDTVELLRDGENEYEFAIFLSFNSTDENFLREYVIAPLEQSLQDLLETNRTVVCIGDHEFRSGHVIADEIVLTLRRSAMVLILLSDSYAQSSYCRQEFEQALQMGKPVMFLIKDTVNEELLGPAMYELYKRNVRIIWSLEDGNYVLKTTWKNVCDSILDVFSKRIP